MEREVGSEGERKQERARERQGGSERERKRWRDAAMKSCKLWGCKLVNKLSCEDCLGRSSGP